MPPRFSRTEEDRHEHDDGQLGADDGAGGEKAHREAGTDTPGRRPERKDERATTPVSGSRDPEPPWYVE
jgi:hypothetical protein